MSEDEKKQKRLKALKTGKIERKKKVKELGDEIVSLKAQVHATQEQIYEIEMDGEKRELKRELIRQKNELTNRLKEARKEIKETENPEVKISGRVRI